eukprot:6724394-Pyramimonas_sp.AAC.1
MSQGGAKRQQFTYYEYAQNRDCRSTLAALPFPVDEPLWTELDVAGHLIPDLTPYQPHANHTVYPRV